MTTPGPVTSPGVLTGDRRSLPTLRGLGLPEAAAMLVVILWGAGNVASKAATVGGLVMTFYRLWLAVPVMLVMLALTGRRLTWSALRTSAVGGAVFGVHLAFFFSSLRLTSVAIVAVIAALQPALVLLIAGRWFGEQVSRAVVIWTLVSIAGAALVVLGPSSGVESTPLGVLLAVANVITFTAYFLLSKRTRDTLGAIEYMTGVIIVASLVVTPVALLSGQDLGAVRTTDWLWIGFVVLVPGAGGHVIINWAHRYLPVSLSSLVVLGTPVVAAVGAWLVLDEPLGPVQLVGSVVVLVAVALVVRAQETSGEPDVTEEAGTAAP